MKVGEDIQRQEKERKRADWRGGHKGLTVADLEREQALR